jgi:hypothetical protein
MGNQANGQQVQPGIISDPMNPRPFQPVGAPVIQNPTLTDLNERVIVGYTPKGDPIYGPKLNVTPPGMRGPVAGGLGTGRFNVPSALAGPGGGGDTSIVTAPGASATAALTETGGSGAKAFADISQQGVAAKNRDALWSQAAADVSKFIPGRGADAKKAALGAVTSLARTLGVDPAKIGIDENNVGSREAFDKLMAQVQTQSGAPSDARMAIVATGTPSSMLTEAGLKQIFAQLRGNDQYTIARAQLAARHTDKGDAQGFEQNVAKNLDPRAFQYSQIEPAKRAEFLKAFSPKDQQAIAQSYNFAMKERLLNGG